MIHDLFLFVCIILLAALYSGLALFYSGSVRQRYALSPLVQALVVLACVFVGWQLLYEKLVLGQSLIGLIGSPAAFLPSIEGLNPALFSMFHAFFCAIALYLVLGAAVERLRLKACLLLSFMWPLLVYVPVAHWVWNREGFLHMLGSVDFAGGIVVHVSAGVAALVLAIQCGRRNDYFNYRPRADQRMIFLGLVLIVIGWCGFNGGSALMWGDTAIKAIQVTWLAAVGGLLSGVLVEYAHTPHRVTLSQLGLSLMSALVMITPAAGVISSGQAIVLGLVAGPLMYYGQKIFHHVLKIDDGLDVFISHAVSGVIGAIVTGMLVSTNVLWANALACLLVALYSAILTWLIVKVMKCLFGVDVKKHLANIDMSDHGERVAEPHE